MNGYPTVLVNRDAFGGLDTSLVNCLKGKSLHVLEADDWAHVLDVVKRHPRPIHVLLTSMGMEADVPILQLYRPKLLFVFVSRPVDVDDVLAKILRLLGLPAAT